MLVIINFGPLIISYHFTRGNKNSGVEISKSNENDFSLDDKEDDFDKEEFELESNKELNNIFGFLSLCLSLI